MRIVAGEWRGRRIEAPPGRDVRPTLDRVREAWMSILQRDIPGSSVLDLFAGSGALGLEALSRGAVQCDFVETASRTLTVLKQNIEELGAIDRSNIRRTDAIKFAEHLEPLSYDLAFADPPYAGGFAKKLADIWLAKPFARILSVEHSSRDQLAGGVETRRYGSAAITFYRFEE
ncbi:MAG TPA: 16S rRNA (guanine(966)-N(2))-methyltransferase RsmD [Gemmatimonadaceae bacterium]|jgi:16S rRNA (guanine966-N2)-methyltransferase|nr:16S rRNA (guanine(966)-N(2))-methyltransferase RsmD [Gemmatimonadaceae bacterium]